MNERQENSDDEKSWEDLSYLLASVCGGRFIDLDQIRCPGRSLKSNPPAQEFIIAARNKGHTQADIADILHIRPETVSKFLRQYDRENSTYKRLPRNEQLRQAIEIIEKIAKEGPTEENLNECRRFVGYND